MNVRIRPPTDRRCEDCGRREQWDDERGVWNVARDDDGQLEAGSVFCLHEWDINGAFTPFEKDDGTAES